MKWGTVKTFVTVLLICSAGFGAGNVWGQEPAKASNAVSLSDQQLSDLADRHQKLIEKLGNREKQELTSSEFTELQALIHDYESFLLRNQENVTAYLLFGKLLRSVGQAKDAFMVFLKVDKIDPNIAVVKQQLGNYFVETGKWQAAYPFFQAAVDLAPKEAIYHFQLGEYLLLYHDLIVEDGILSEEAIKKTTRGAFEKASELEPENMDYLFRTAECLEEEHDPDWKLILESWDRILPGCKTDLRKQAASIHKARALFELKHDGDAKKILEEVRLPVLQETKKNLLERYDKKTSEQDAKKEPEKSDMQENSARVNMDGKV